MLRHRVIPSLLLKGSGLVKTIKFRNPSYVGDPINAIRIFNEKEVDELFITDIECSKSNTEINYPLISSISEECFMPLTYSGGIKSVDQARSIFNLGVEKICLQSSVLNNPLFIKELVSIFGSQSIVISVDIRMGWRGKPKLYNSSLRKTHSGNWSDWLQFVESLGAGEILLNSVDKDGTRAGPDFHLIKSASNLINIPLIASGGVSSLTDIKDCILNGASAVACGSLFIYHGPHRAVLISYPHYNELKTLFEF